MRMNSLSRSAGELLIIMSKQQQQQSKKACYNCGSTKHLVAACTAASPARPKVPAPGVNLRAPKQQITSAQVQNIVAKQVGAQLKDVAKKSDVKAAVRSAAAFANVSKTVKREVNQCVNAFSNTGGRHVVTGKFGEGRLDKSFANRGAHGLMHVENTSEGEVVSGSELITTTGPVNVAAGAIMAETVINPTQYGPRLANEASNWTQWEADYIAFQFVGAEAPVGTPANGLLNMGAQTDPSRELPEQSSDGVQAMVEWGVNNVETNIYKTEFLELKLDKQNNLLFVDDSGDVRLNAVAIAALQAASVINTGTAALGNWILWYRFRFSVPVSDDTIPPLYLESFSNIVDGPVGSPCSIPFTATPTPQPNPAQSNATIGQGIGAEAPLYASGSGNFVGNIDNFSLLQGPIDQVLIVPAGSFLIEEYTIVGSTSNNATFMNTNTTSIATTGPVTVSKIDGLQNSAGTQTASFQAPLFNSISPVTLMTAAGRIFTGSSYRRFFASATGVWSIQALTPPIAAVNGALTPSYAVGFRLTRISHSLAVSTGPLPGISDGSMKLRVGYRNAMRAERSIKRSLQEVISADAVSCGYTPESAEQMIAFDLFLSSAEQKLVKHVSTMILPAVAAAISWFVTTYGRRLSTAAVDWAVRKIEKRLAPGEDADRKYKLPTDNDVDSEYE